MSEAFFAVEAEGFEAAVAEHFEDLGIFCLRERVLLVLLAVRVVDVAVKGLMEICGCWGRVGSWRAACKTDLGLLL